MPRKLRPLRRFIDPAPTPSGCRGLCMDMQCPACWDGFFMDPDDLEAVHEPPPLRLLVEMDDDTYAALDAEAVGRGVTVEQAAATVLREWSERRR